MNARKIRVRNGWMIPVAAKRCDRPAMDWLSFADAAGVALWQRHVATGKVYCSEEAGRLFGLSGGGEYEGSAFLDRLQAEDRDRVRAAFDAAVSPGSTVDVDFRVLGAEGAHWVRCTGRIVADRGGDPEWLAGVVTDKVVAEQRISEMNAALRELSARLMRSQDEERRRFARDLHDSTAQSLTALSFSIKLVADLPVVAASVEASTALLDCAAMVEACIREVRTMSYLLHPMLLDDLGLEPALRNFAAGFERRTGIAVRFHSSAARARWPDAIQTTTFRFVQEALSNILRHAGATDVLVELTEAADGLTVQVTDNGCGFPREVLNGSGTLVGSGVGIAGMRDRARSLGGAVTIQSSSQGSTLQLVIPTNETN
jgi:signal transduction histidine kinase